MPGSMAPVPITVRGPIPWTSVVGWAQLHGLGPEETRLLASVIRILDVQRAERISSELRSKR